MGRLGFNCNIVSLDENWKKNEIEVSEELETSQFISFQFAPYAYSSFGINRKNLSFLAKLLHSKKVHVNFHEIWIGAHPNASWKDKFIGWRQKREIFKFLEMVNPSFITCSNPAAMDRLNQVGIRANHLYLFGNIPYFRSPNTLVSDNLRVALFGTPYRKFPYNILAEKLTKISESANKPIELSIIGRQREQSGLEHIRQISEDFNFSLFESGELSTQSISTKLQNSDLGLSTTPYDILGKSVEPLLLCLNTVCQSLHLMIEIPRKRSCLFSNNSQIRFSC